MPAAPLIPFVKWPGLYAGVRSLTYTCSQGTTPGTAVLVTNPQNTAPLLNGNLLYGAGINGVRLLDARLVNITSERSLGGIVWVWQIEDRRWRWRHGAVSGNYNQLDHHGKLVPWTIRSPYELALLCLREMGETNFAVDLPAGLTRRDGRNYALRLEKGQNFPDFGTNPPTQWDAQNAAAALTQLCGRYGRRIFYDPLSNRTVIARSGGSLPIPFASLHTDGVSIKAKPVPRAVVAVGDHKRVQMMLPVEAVGKEWDGTFVPIDQLSYAPVNDPNPVAQVVHVLAINAGTDWIDCTVDGKTVSGQGRTDLRNKLLADPFATGLYAITGTGSVPDPLVFTRKEKGTNGEITIEFQTVTTPPPVAYVSAEVKTVGTKRKGWSICSPSDPIQAEATDRLTKDQAIALARETVFRCYRIKNEDVSGTGDPIMVPGYGRLRNRWQLLLTPNKVEQIKPEEIDQTGINLAAFFERGVPGPYYNGHSQDQPAMVYGSYFKDAGNVFWTGPGANTDASKRVHVPFSTDPYEQIITFSQPVFKLGGGNTGGPPMPAELVLECAVKVLDPDTNQIVRHVSFLDLGGPAPQHVEVFPDLVEEVVGKYQQDSVGEGYTEDEFGNKTLKAGAAFLPTFQLVKAVPFAPQETQRRAKIYLDGMARQFQQFPAETVTFNGVFKVPMSATIQQVTWSIDGNGIYTTLSANSEHDPAYPSWLGRRLQENLPPVDRINAERGEDGQPKQIPGTSSEAQRAQR